MPVKYTFDDSGKVAVYEQNIKVKINIVYYSTYAP